MFIRWMIALGLLLTATGTSSHLFAQEPTFPLLQNEQARLAFVSGSYGTCLERQRAFAENANLSTTQLVIFCKCYARALAEMINGAEYEALMLGKLIDSF